MSAMPEMSHNPQRDEYYTDLSVGEILRRTRLHYGQSLADIERVLRIRAGQLEALETGQVERLPGRVYAIGFVRSYSEYLGLDGDRMVHLFKNQTLGGKARPELHFPVPASESKVPDVKIVAGSLAAMLLVVILWFVLQGGSEEESAIPPAPSPAQIRADADLNESPAVSFATAPQNNNGTLNNGVLPDPAGGTGTIGGLQAQESAQLGSGVEGAGPQTQDAPGAAVPAADADAIAGTEMTGAADANAPEVKPEKRVLIEVTQRSWVEIRDRNDKVILSRVLEPGNSYYVPADREGLTLATGNAGGLVISVDGEELPAFGRPGDVRRNIPLDAEILKESFN